MNYEKTTTQISYVSRQRANMPLSTPKANRSHVGAPSTVTENSTHILNENCTPVANEKNEPIARLTLQHQPEEQKKSSLVKLVPENSNSNAGSADGGLPGIYKVDSVRQGLGSCLIRFTSHGCWRR